MVLALMAHVPREVQELRILQELPAVRALVLDHNRSHLIKQQPAGHTAEVGEGLLKADS